jgi:RimJ/RimL family protein N-acetyltransferase
VRPTIADVPLTLDDVDWPVRTERLLIRRCRVEDAEPLFPLRTHPEVARWAMSVPTDLDIWRPRFTDPAIAPHVLVTELHGEVIGELVLAVKDAGAQREVRDDAGGCEAELGWLIGPEHQGQGLATEAGAALIRLAFEVLGLRRVHADTFEANTASWRVMEKLGMRLETRSRRDVLHRELGWSDGRGYALLADEWLVDE